MTGLLGALACVDTVGEGAPWGAGARVADSGGGETGLEIDVDRPWPRPCRLMWEARNNEDGPFDWDYYVYTATRDGWLRHEGSTRDYDNPDKVPKGRWVVIDRFGNPLNEVDEFTIPSFDADGRLWRKQAYTRWSAPWGRWVERYTYSDEEYTASGDILLTHKIKDTEGAFDYFERWDYDSWGRLLTYERGGLSADTEPARETYGYDDRGNMITKFKEEDPFGLNDKLWEWGYDDEDRRLWERYTTSAGSAWRYYDNEGFQTTEYHFVDMAVGSTTTTTYDENGNQLSYVWDNRSYLAELTAPGIDTIGEWTYDEHGNMTSELWYEGDGSFREGWSWGWDCH